MVELLRTNGFCPACKPILNEILMTELIRAFEFQMSQWIKYHEGVLVDC